MRRIIFIGFILITLSAIGMAFWLFRRAPSQQQLAKAFPNDSYEKIFISGRVVTLLALNADRKIEGAEDFHGFSVSGKAVIKDESFQKLVKRAFLESLAEGKESAKCFNPRHGLRISDGVQSLDLVICFECKNFISYAGVAKSEGEISGSAEVLYTQILKDAKIEISK